MLVKAAAHIERLSGRYAHAHLFVTDAMRTALTAAWDLRGVTRVLHDRPPKSFCRTSAADAHALFERIGPDLWGTQPFTNSEGWRQDRPALVVTSTSYTADEDLGMLLDAADLYDRHAAPALPRLAIVVTGKGPLKSAYEQEMRRRSSAWRRVSITTAWLAAEDYPVLLGAADVGVSLHSSSSGLDLPMKVVDMLGCGTPVCALQFACLHELVVAGVNGQVFTNASELCDALQRVLGGKSTRATFVGGDAQNWDDNWTRVVAPLL
ncbi:chitobiosyldiphosphodolichol beta-mannosyltransferase [Malassezia cuniculi]|uniref:Chitobiosyldiphosphodolichol beta-mannosyltransferase n=1 Tax=Malassezia cuniculi TaxID=948313 RepID=A0AAF0EUE7_9BASI|nr:chitobiosyldiphosphodolichol beta-mannosyltransferase [Malassezia cuniculi]